MDGLELSNPDLTLEGKELIPTESMNLEERECFLRKYSQLVPEVSSIRNEIILETTNGEHLSIEEIQDGKPLAIYFFATWCPVCNQNLMALNQTYKEFDDKVNFLVIQFDPTETPEQIDEYKENKNYEWPFAYYSQKAITEFKVVTQTSKIVIDVDGNVCYFDGFGLITQDEWSRILATCSVSK